MFYQFNDDVTTVETEDISPCCLAAGYVTPGELEKIYDRFSFSRSTVDICLNSDENTRAYIEVYDDYSFAVFNLINEKNINKKRDCIGLYIKKNLFIVVDISDNDASTRNKFFESLGRYSCVNITTEKLIYAFLDCLISKNSRIIEDTELEITRLEELVLKDKSADDFNLFLLQIKKELLIIRKGYEQLIDIGEVLQENDNEILEDEELNYLSNFTEKVKRFRQDVVLLKDSVNHLQDAYSAYLDLKLNHTMQLFTVITTIFFPLTLIAGWYGMNFTSMPELTWKYGYLFAIFLSVAVVVVLTYAFKKKKWL